MRAVRVFGGFVLVLLLAAAGLWFARLPLAEMAARQAIKAQGFEAESLRITRLNLSEMTVADLNASADTVFARLEDAAVTFDWRTLISQRRVQDLRLGPGLVRVAIAPGENGGFPTDDGRGGARKLGPLPFDGLHVDDLAIELTAPQGAATGVISGTFETAQGGAAAIKLASDGLGFGAWTLASTAFEGNAAFDPDGALQIEGSVAGQSIATPYGVLRELQAVATIAGGSWLDLVAGDFSNFAGQGRVSLQRLTGALTDDWSQRAATLIGAPVDAFAASGALDLQWDATGFSVAGGDDAFRIVADNGTEVRLVAVEQSPLINIDGDKQQAAFGYALTGPAVAVSGEARAVSTAAGWDLAAASKIDAYRHPRFSIENAQASFEGRVTDADVVGMLSVASDIDRVSVGRLSVSDASARGDFSVAYDRASGVANVAFADRRCLVVDEAQIRLAGQDMDSSVSKASLCNETGPVAVIRMSGEPVVDFAGLLSAETARYRLGRTRFSGAPPVFMIDGVYQPLKNETRAHAKISGGSVVLNNFLRFSDARGAMDVSLVGSDFLITGVMDRVRAAETRDAPFAAPAYGTADFTLKDSVATFDYSIATRSGVAIGEGTGEHHVRTGMGDAVFTTNQLTFAGDGGLQPELMMPVLRGVIGATTGAAQADAQFTWGPDGIGSAADIVLHGVTFEGPTRVVSQTQDVDGRLRFSSLWPPTTDGVQSVSVGGVDLSQLQLEDGVVRFEMPGDGTLYVEHAEFPWFGGRLGVYDAIASITGGGAKAPLQAVDVDITEMLDFINLNGLTGEGTLEGVLPLVVEDGRARIENGVLRSVGPGSVSYQGAATDEAAAAGGQAQIAFDILRDLRFDALEIAVDGPLDGRLNFQMTFEGSGEISLNDQPLRMPVIYRINLDAALLDLLNQAVLTQDIQLQINRAQQGEDAAP